jgi:hypothetical protein
MSHLELWTRPAPLTLGVDWCFELCKIRRAIPKVAHSIPSFLQLQKEHATQSQWRYSKASCHPCQPTPISLPHSVSHLRSFCAWANLPIPGTILQHQVQAQGSRTLWCSLLGELGHHHSFALSEQYRYKLQWRTYHSSAHRRCSLASYLAVTPPRHRPTGSVTYTFPP